MPEIERRRRKPLVIEVLLWNGTNGEQVDDFTGGRIGFGRADGQIEVWNDQEKAWIVVPLGHYVANGALGEFYPVSPEAYEKTLEPDSGPAAAPPGTGCVCYQPPGPHAHDSDEDGDCAACGCGRHESPERGDGDGPAYGKAAMAVDDPGFLTVKEVAALLRVSGMTVTRLIADGELAAKRVGRRFRIREADFRAYLDGTDVRAAPLAAVRELAESWAADDGHGASTREMLAEAACGRAVLGLLDGTCGTPAEPEPRTRHEEPRDA